MKDFQLSGKNFSSEFVTNMDTSSSEMSCFNEAQKEIEKADSCINASVQAGDLETYSVQKSYKCNQCEYASVSAGSLRRHLKTHSGEKSYKCSQCDYASIEAGNLRRHLKTHNVENIALKI